MATQAPVEAVFEELMDRYGAPPEEAVDPFEVLVAAILSHRTDEDITYDAATRLLDEHGTPAELARADPDCVASIIKPVGFYNQKGQALVRAAQHLLDHHGGDVPRREETLLQIPWVGRKTMNCVRVYAFGEPRVAVDTHVHRIANRLGWADTQTPEATEAALTGILQAEQRRCVNELLVRFGREICQPRSPRCEACPIATLCPSAQAGPGRPDGDAEGATMLARIASRR